MFDFNYYFPILFLSLSNHLVKFYTYFCIYVKYVDFHISHSLCLSMISRHTTVSSDELSDPGCFSLTLHFSTTSLYIRWHLKSKLVKTFWNYASVEKSRSTDFSQANEHQESVDQHEFPVYWLVFAKCLTSF